MALIDLDKGWKVWVYRLGLLGSCVTVIGLPLVAIDASLGSDVLKMGKKPKLNNGIEIFFFIFALPTIMAIIGLGLGVIRSLMM
ncbi:hypothetical protein KY361_05200 [Candidatus Woesearchaeota archaeon]|nr:hypothetical protein [Candidatus Woesearchaeota archaeon]